MSITHETSLRNSLCSAVASAIDSGSSFPTPTLEVATSTAFSTILAVLKLGLPSFGAPVNGVMTGNPVTNETDAPAAGTAAAFRIKDRSGAERLRGTVTAIGGGGDMQLSDPAIKLHDIIAVSSMTYTASP